MNSDVRIVYKEDNSTNEEDGGPNDGGEVVTTVDGRF
jgi:hypothetical protein